MWVATPSLNLTRILFGKQIGGVSTTLRLMLKVRTICSLVENALLLRCGLLITLIVFTNVVFLHGEIKAKILLGA